MQKINQKNTWELNLIDHLTELIKVEEEDTETNFQKVGCVILTDSLVKVASILNECVQKLILTEQKCRLFFVMIAAISSELLSSGYLETNNLCVCVF